MKLPVIILAGVSLTGKTTLAKSLRAACPASLSFRFVEGDDLHEDSSIQKMGQGQPLDDADRIKWRKRIEAVIQAADDSTLTVISCSALRREFRDQLRAVGPVQIVFLDMSPESAALRAHKRVIQDWLDYRNHDKPMHYFQPWIFPELQAGQFNSREMPTAQELALGDIQVCDLDQLGTATPQGPLVDFEPLAKSIVASVLDRARHS
jgi:carbohydrate kinase (thermoresistant glucokinase family)